MKLRIRKSSGFPLNLTAADAIKVMFPYENGEVLEKRNVTILDAVEGKIKVDLTEFEIQGLKVGKGQTFFARVQIGEDEYHVVFPKGLNVELRNERKALA